MQAETLFALRAPDQYSAREFSDAWRNVLLYDEHTWGAPPRVIRRGGLFEATGEPVTGPIELPAWGFVTLRCERQ